MRLVHKEKIILWQIVKKGVGSGARLASRKDAGVVLNPRAEAHLTEHFHIVAGALLDALRLKQLTL